MLNSAIYTGWVNHRRVKPKPHGFRYQVFMMYLDLNELPSLFSNMRFWSFGKRNIANFNRADYYGDASKPLKDEISGLVKATTGHAPRGAIRLLTNMRYFGHCFNPVSFYYCFDANNQTLQAIVSHITNTPWGEDYAYVHDLTAENHHEKSTKNGLIHVFKLDKNFHVSPFMPMDIQYDWAFKLEQDQLFIHMKNFQKLLNADPVEIFSATLALQKSPLTEKSLNWLLIKYPFMTLEVVAAIYWNALKLYLKRVPFYAHHEQLNKG